jgi:hypothetical protein
VITISGYNFDGPYTSTGFLSDNAGVYAILTRRGQADAWTLIDAGESGGVKTRIEGHDRKDCWRRRSQGVVAAAVLYTPNWSAEQRRLLESSVRGQYAPACGTV